MGTSNSLTDSSATFYTTSDGLRGCYVELIAGTGASQRNRIVSNTATTLKCKEIWTTNPSTDTVYQIGNIDFYALSAELDAEVFGYPAGSTLIFNRPMIIECAEQAETYSTGRVVLTNGSTTATGEGTTWVNATHRASNFFVGGYPDREFFISSVSSATSLTLTSAWTGQTGNYTYKIGAKLLKVIFYLNGSTTAYKTVYADMASSPVSVPIQCKCKSIQYKLQNNRVDEPVEIYSITIKEPTFYV